MNPVQIAYMIAEYGASGIEFRQVKGWAIDSDLPVRFCVRILGEFRYVADHYDTGYRIGVGFPSFISAKEGAERILVRTIFNGQYEEALKAIEARK